MMNCCKIERTLVKMHAELSFSKFAVQKLGRHSQKYY